MPLTISNTPESEIIGFYHECHSPKTNEMLEDWIERMIDKLGPDDCKFLIKSIRFHLKGMWMSKGTYLYVPKISEAYRWSWGEAAVKCTNHSELEAVRIINDKEAVDSKGNIYKMEPYKPILPPAYEDEDLDQDLWGKSDLDKARRLAVEAAEGEGLPPRDDKGPDEIGDNGEVVFNAHPICPFGLGLT